MLMPTSGDEAVVNSSVRRFSDPSTTHRRLSDMEKASPPAETIGASRAESLPPVLVDELPPGARKPRKDSSGLEAFRRGLPKKEKVRCKWCKSLLPYFKNRINSMFSCWKDPVYGSMLVLMLIGGIMGIVLILPQKPNSGKGMDDWLDFGPRKTMLVKDWTNGVLLAISRETAYMMYPCMILIFCSKAHSARSWLWHTQAKLYVPFLSRLHDVHIYAGWKIFLLGWLHSVTHLVRWFRLNCMEYSWTTQTGITGYICWICVTTVVLLFGVNKFKENVKYETRKWLHIVGGLGFGIGAALHAPATNILYVLTTVVAIYLADFLYANIFLIYEVKVCNFSRLEDSIALHFDNPPGYKQKQCGYVNICIPFVNKYQWHALSIVPKVEENQSLLMIATRGDWTKKLHAEIIAETKRPVWIQGPFMTPFAVSVDYDNIITVATGVGISTCMGVIETLKDTRTTNFIWITRDPELVLWCINRNMFEGVTHTKIFYTGKKELKLADSELPPGLSIYRERPNLRSAVCSIILTVDSHEERGCFNVNKDGQKIEIDEGWDTHDSRHDSKCSGGNSAWKPTSSMVLRKSVGALSPEMQATMTGRWLVLYSGLGAFVSDQLDSICKEFNIEYRHEMFDW